MKPRTTEDILFLLDGGLLSAALGAAMEFGLFWRLESAPSDVRKVARELDIPGNRCRYWLEVLRDAGLLDRTGDTYEPSATTRETILASYSRDSWALLAEESRQRLSSTHDLLHRLRGPGSNATAEAGVSQHYVEEMARDPGMARRFTRMLFELHHSWAEDLAAALDMDGVARLLDLGGGSGVLSMAMARRHPGLTAVVVDVDTVCRTGREIARRESLQDRVSFHPANFLRDELPSGFDAVLECDVNVYREDLFRKVHEALNPGGRFVILDLFAPGPDEPPPTREHWALEHSLDDPGHSYPTADEVRSLLEAAGFRLVRETPTLPQIVEGAPFRTGWSVIEARRDSPDASASWPD